MYIYLNVSERGLIAKMICKFSFVLLTKRANSCGPLPSVCIDLSSCFSKLEKIKIYNQNKFNCGIKI